MDYTAWMVVIAASSAVFGAFSTVIGFVLRMSRELSDKFTHIEDSLKALLDTHEHKDQHRHEDNIQRFAKVEAQLGILIKNGDSLHN